MKTYVIYHDNCADGLSAAALHQIFHPKQSNIEYIAGSYSNHTYPDFTGSSVLFLDFSFKEKEFRELLKVAIDVQVIDHHITAYEYLSKIIDEDNVFSNYIYESTECGTSLVWKTFSKQPIPLAVSYVRDQDIYVWHHREQSVPFCLAMETLDRNLETFYTFWINTLMYSDHIKPPSSFISLGSNLLKLRDNYVKQIASHHTIHHWNGNDVIFVNCPNLFVNNVSDLLIASTGANYLIAYSHTPKGIAFSLRSRDINHSTLPYTNLISSSGGGHVCASGAFLSYSNLATHEVNKFLFGG